MTTTKHRPRTSLIAENAWVAFGTLRNRGFRSFLTVLGVFIGVFIIMAVASVLNGFRQGVVDDLQQFGTSVIYVQRFPPIMMQNPSAEMRKRKDLLLEDAQAIREECDALAAVTPVHTSFDGRRSVKYEGEESEGLFMQGVYPAARDVIGIELSEGRFFSEEEEQRRAPVCVVGRGLVDAFFRGRSPIGKIIVANGRRLRIVGTLEKFHAPALGGGGENPRDKMIFVPFGLLRAMYPGARGIDIMARAKDGRLAEAVEQIEEVLRLRRHVAWKDPNDFDVSTAQSMTETFDQIVFATLAVMFSLSTVAFMVGGIGVMNVMLASVKERTREIGVRRAIGARRRDITWQFLTEAMTMTGLGGLLGVVAGESLMRLVHAFLPMVPCAVPMWARLFGFLGSVGVGLVFGIWPAIAAARLDPIEALRYE